MKITASFLAALALLVLCTSLGHADLVVGTISDFQDGTVGGWAGGTVSNVADAGPLGAGDNALQLSNGGVAGNFAMFNLSVAGVIDPSVASITVDILRPTGEVTGDIRLVLFDSFGGDRWTSTTASSVVGDGLWDTYTFSILESDLTHVLDTGGTYAQLVNNLDRIMFRHDPGVPNGGGVPLAGTMLFDNIVARSAVPEPAGTAIAIFLLAGFAARRRR